MGLVHRVRPQVREKIAGRARVVSLQVRSSLASISL